LEKAFTRIYSRRRKH